MRRKINLVFAVLAVLVVSLSFSVYTLPSTSTSEIISLQGSRQLPASDYYEGVDESATFSNVESEAGQESSVGQEESEQETTPHIDFYYSWVSDDRTDTGSSVVVGFKARWNDTLEDIGWGLCAEVYDGTRYYPLEYHPDGWTLTTSYDEVCKKNFTVVSVGYFGERYELNGESVLFEQTVESPDVIWDRIQIVRQTVTEITTQVPADYTLFAYIGVAGVVVIAVIALALLRRRRDIEEEVLSPWD